MIEGEYAGKIVAVAIGGMGRRGRRRAAEVLIAGHRPRWLISAGFAGALNPAFARNDLIVARRGDRPRRWTRIVVDQPPELGASVQHAKGRLLTVDQLVAALPRQERAAPFLPGRPGRHGNLGRGGGLP